MNTLRNDVKLIGRLGQDPEVRNLEKDNKVATFSIATGERYTDKEGNKKDTTEWHNIVAWRGLAEVAEKYIKKGTQIYVEGKIQTRQWEKEGIKRYTTEIYADTIQLLGKKPDSAETASSVAAPAADALQAPPPTTDDLPF